MKRQAAFTLTELLIVVGLIALLVAIMVPSFGAVLERSRQTICKTNLFELARSYMVYKTQNTEQLPFFVNPKWDMMISGTFLDAGWVRLDGTNDPKTGTNRELSPYDANAALTGCAYNVSSLLFMLISSVQSDPKLFICPSTKDVPEPSPLPTRGEMHQDVSPSTKYWDFSPYSVGNADHVSYSTLVPLNSNPAWASSGQAPIFETPLYAAGKPDTAKLALVSDRTPDWDRVRCLMPKKWTAVTQQDILAAPYVYNSQNHKGRSFNVLYVNGSVATVTTPLCGGVVGMKDTSVHECRDNIFTASNDATGGTSTTTTPGADSLKAAARLSANDSFLRGPKSR